LGHGAKGRPPSKQGREQAGHILDNREDSFGVGLAAMAGLHQVPHPFLDLADDNVIIDA
jgi:hypothetical protein